MNNLEQLALNINNISPEIYKQTLESSIFSNYLGIYILSAVFVTGLISLIYGITQSKKSYSGGDMATPIGITLIVIALLFLPCPLIDLYFLHHYPDSYVIKSLMGH